MQLTRFIFRERTRPGRLVTSTIVATLVAATLHAVVLTYVAAQGVSRIMEEEDRKQTGESIRKEVFDHFGEDLFRALSREEMREETAGALLKVMQDHGGFRIKVYDEKGVILWSDEPRLIGLAFPDNFLLSSALSGEMVSKIERPKRSEHVYEHAAAEYVIETYVPIFSRSGGLLGVVEVYRHSDALMEGIDHVRHVVWIGASLATGVLCGVLAVIVGFGQKRVLDLQEEVRFRGDELEREKSKLEKIVESVRVGLYLVDRSERILWANQMMAKWAGETGGLVGQPCYRACGKRDAPCESCAARAAMRSGRESHAERTQIGPDGQEQHFHTVAWPILDAGGGWSQSLVLVQDVTERMHLESQVIHQEKMAALGQIAAGIAHEVGNPLSSISAVIQKMSRQCVEGVEEDLSTLREQVARIDRIVHQVGSFSRRAQDSKQPIDLNLIIREALRVVELDTRWRNYEVSTDLSPLPLIVHGSTDRLIQVFLNILLNARDALGPAGRIGIRTSHLGAEVEAVISDTGPGVPVAIRNRIFDPFFTTKPAGESTGLGLHVSWNIVADHGGTISVRGEDGRGAVFGVRLPAGGKHARTDPSR